MVTSTLFDDKMYLVVVKETYQSKAIVSEMRRQLLENVDRSKIELESIELTDVGERK